MRYYYYSDHFINKLNADYYSIRVPVSFHFVHFIINEYINFHSEED